MKHTINGNNCGARETYSHVSFFNKRGKIMLRALISDKYNFVQFQLCLEQRVNGTIAVCALYMRCLFYCNGHTSLSVCIKMHIHMKITER